MLKIVIRILAACLVALCVPVAPLRAEGDRPNILIITVDDMSCDSVGAYGCKLERTTPNMDALAKTAMRFRFAHVQVGNCMPSRNVMWSGRYPHNNGVEGFYQVPKPGFPVLCDLAKQAGYFTAIRHKVSHSTPYSPYGWDLILDEVGEPRPHVKDAASYGESARAGIAAARDAGKPFCMLVNISDPHKPFYSQVKGGGKDPYVPSRVFTADEVPVPGFLPDDRVVREELALYYSSVRRADDGVGAVLEALEASGLAESTLVMFLSDHGMPLPFAKTQLYHHSTRTPLMVRLPGVTKPNTEDGAHMVSAVDFLPTLLDVVGIEHPSGLDGRSFAPLLAGETQANRDFVVKEYNENSGAKRNPMRGIETREYLYLFNPWANGTRKMATATNGTQTYRRMQQLAKTDSSIASRLNLADFRTVEELYHVAEDPDCLVNLVGHAEHQEILQSLRGKLHEHLVATGDPVSGILQERDPVAMEEFVATSQLEADARRSSKRKKSAGSAPRKLKGAIKLQRRHVNLQHLPKVSVTVVHALADQLGKQKLHVTLKDAGLKRIERKVVAISGSGKTVVQFDLPSRDVEIGAVAAFVGEAYDVSLEHVQVLLKQ
ncbi:MAG: hypothetical protein Aurels2KO_19410 [Aureliella sp.]